jgi:hypothetical protein
MEPLRGEIGHNRFTVLARHEGKPIFQRHKMITTALWCSEESGHEKDTNMNGVL